MKWQHVDWTSERKSRVRELWDQGHSASQIAAMLDIVTTRNAVIGLARRCGFPSRRTGQPRTPKPPECTAGGIAAGSAAPPGFRNLALEALRYWHCRWPGGDGPYTFAASRSTAGRTAYKHHRTAHYGKRT